jgi:hypothetical protein
LVDEAFKVWLIEVNTNPCLEESSNLLRVLLPRMIDDALKLTVDILFPKRRKKDGVEGETVAHKVPDYADTENMWDCLCQLHVFRRVIPPKGISIGRPPARTNDPAGSASPQSAAKIESALQSCHFASGQDTGTFDNGT